MKTYDGHPLKKLWTLKMGFSYIIMVTLGVYPYPVSGEKEYYMKEEEEGPSTLTLLPLCRGHPSPLSKRFTY